MILDFIEHVIADYGITTVVFKLQDSWRSSNALDALVTKIRELIKECQLHTYAYTLSNIKQVLLQAQTTTIKEITAYVVERYPELTEEYEKEQRNRNSHYKKMFEAVALGICLHRQNLLPPTVRE